MSITVACRPCRYRLEIGPDDRGPFHCPECGGVMMAVTAPPPPARRDDRPRYEDDVYDRPRRRRAPDDDDDYDGELPPRRRDREEEVRPATPAPRRPKARKRSSESRPVMGCCFLALGLVMMVGGVIGLVAGERATARVRGFCLGFTGAGLVVMSTHYFRGTWRQFQ